MNYIFFKDIYHYKDFFGVMKMEYARNSLLWDGISDVFVDLKWKQSSPWLGSSYHKWWVTEDVVPEMEPLLKTMFKVLTWMDHSSQQSGAIVQEKYLCVSLSIWEKEPPTLIQKAIPTFFESQGCHCVGLDLIQVLLWVGIHLQPTLVVECSSVGLRV